MTCSWASKVMPGNASYQGTLKACEASLKRLGPHYLDLYLLHWPGNHPVLCQNSALLKWELYA